MTMYKHDLPKRESFYSTENIGVKFPLSSQFVNVKKTQSLDNWINRMNNLSFMIRTKANQIYLTNNNTNSVH